MKNTQILISLVVVILLVVGGIFFATHKHFKVPFITSQISPTATPVSSSSASQILPLITGINAQLINVTANGFVPSVVTIKKGDRIFWFNSSGKVVSVNSDAYPTNALYPILNIGNITNGSTGSVLFEKTGTYTYHNQHIPSQVGKIIVK